MRHISQLQSLTAEETQSRKNDQSILTAVEASSRKDVQPLFEVLFCVHVLFSTVPASHETSHFSGCFTVLKPRQLRITLFILADFRTKREFMATIAPKLKFYAQIMCRQSFEGSRTFPCVFHRQSSESARLWNGRVKSGSQNGEGKKREEEKLWLDFFSEPWDWWDHRFEKVNPRFPDFKHKKTQESLWLNSKWIPPWVEAKLAAIVPGTFESGNLAWNHKLSRYAKAGEHKKLIQLYDQMQSQGINADKYTYPLVLCACAKLGLLEKGRRIHRQITENGYELELFVGSTLIDMYGKCGSLEEAETLFNKMPTKNVVTWNAMIRGYVKGNAARQALELYQRMEKGGVDPDPFTFVQFLNACASVEALQEGRQFHKEIIRRGYQSNSFVRNSLVDMYAKCGSMKDAELVFSQKPTRDVVAWTAMILGYVKCGGGPQALELYQLMKQERIDPDPVTLVAVLNACASSAALEDGRNAHKEIVQRGYDTNAFVQNSLVDMYAKCGSIEDALRVFSQMSTRHVMAWTAIILGYVKCGEGWQAIEMYGLMQKEGVHPDCVIFKVVLNACASVAALEEGRGVHEEIIQRGYEADVSLRNCLIDMYAKCGSLEDAKRVFDKMLSRDVVTWNVMLAGYGRHGYAKEAVEHFKQMCDVVDVNAITFISLLSACSHGGLVDVGLEYFKSMSRVYKISPTVDHYACVVDLLGRAGFLREAEELILGMPIDPDATVWMSLLGACRAHGLVEMAERCAKRVLELNPQNFAGQVLLSNIYVATDKLHNGAESPQERLDKFVVKTPGCTWIRVNKSVCSFVVDCNRHPLLEEIFAELKRLSGQMKDIGYVSDAQFMLQCVDERKKEFHLCHHSEKLAIAFGIISTAPSTPIRIVKDLQVCGDCHADTKVIAKISGRTITVRDANCVHVFEAGM